MVDETGKRHKLEDKMETYVKEKHQGWVASLSNGETVFQTPNIPGERTAWGKLQERCEEEEIFITQIQLQMYGNTLVGIPNADGYTAFYEYTQSWAHRDIGATHQGIGSVLGDWVSIMFSNESGHVWQGLRPLADMREHCQLKPAHAIRTAGAKPAMPAVDVDILQVLDISDEEPSPELSEEDFKKASAWFVAVDASLYEGDGNLSLTYSIFQSTGVSLTEEDVENFRFAFWKL